MKDLVPRYANFCLENQIEKFCAGELQTMGESDVSKNVGKKFQNQLSENAKVPNEFHFFQNILFHKGNFENSNLYCHTS